MSKKKTKTTDETEDDRDAIKGRAEIPIALREAAAEVMTGGTMFLLMKNGQSLHAGLLLVAAVEIETQARDLEAAEARRDAAEAEAHRLLNEAHKWRMKAERAAAPSPTDEIDDERRRDDDAPAPAKCKHPEWDTTKTPPVCKKCGHVKSNRGRKSELNPAANVAVATVEGVTKIDPPSVPLPLPPAPPAPPAPTPAKGAKPKGVELQSGAVVDEEEDPYENGTVGAR